MCGEQREERLSRDQRRRAEAHCPPPTPTHMGWGKTFQFQSLSSPWCSKFQGQLTSCIDSAVFFLGTPACWGIGIEGPPASQAHVFLWGHIENSSCSWGLIISLLTPLSTTPLQPPSWAPVLFPPPNPTPPPDSRIRGVYPSTTQSFLLLSCPFPPPSYSSEGAVSFWEDSTIRLPTLKVIPGQESRS